MFVRIQGFYHQGTEQEEIGSREKVIKVDNKIISKNTIIHYIDSITTT